MNSKRITMLCACIGGWVGASIPAVWGGASLSIIGIVCSAVGAVVGIWIAFTIKR